MEILRKNKRKTEDNEYDLKSTIPSKENLLFFFENLICKNADNHNTDLEQYIEIYQFLKEKNITSILELKLELKESISALRIRIYGE